MENKELHRELISKHINFDNGSNFIASSVSNFSESGKCSGSFYQQLQKYAEEYHKEKLKQILIS